MADTTLSLEQVLEDTFSITHKQAVALKNWIQATKTVAIVQNEDSSRMLRSARSGMKTAFPIKGEREAIQGRATIKFIG